MATVTKTWYQSDITYGTRTITTSVTASNETVTGENIEIKPSVSVASNVLPYGDKRVYNAGKVTASGYTAQSKGIAVKVGDTIKGSIKYASSSAVAVNATATMPIYTPLTLQTADLFDSSNKTSATVAYSLWLGYDGESYSIEAQTINNTGNDFIQGDNGQTLYSGYLTLDAPPTFTSTQVSYDKNYVYAGLTTASVTISGATAQYGGTISASSLTIGNQTVTGSGNGTLSILLDTAGTFTPIVTVTDSRGQTTTKTLDAITVNSYVAPEVAFTLERTNSSGTVDDEGTYAVATASFNWTDAIATLSQPTVSAIDSDGTTLSVSATWYTDRAFTTAVDWSSTSSWSSPKTLYGRIGTLPVNESSQVTITPNDSEGSGTAQTQTLASAFYTIDFLAGGHGIAFGQPASEEGFFCNMDSHFSDNAHVMRALFDFVYPVGSYYETSDTTFDPNVTWGGTWALETEGQVHVSSGTNYAVSGALTNTSDGGEENHTLTVNELAKHSHRILQANNSGTAGTWVTNASTTNTRKVAYQGGQTYSDVIELSGGSQPHNIMQPYIVVNRWHRTA